MNYDHPNSRVCCPRCLGGDPPAEDEDECRLCQGDGEIRRREAERYELFMRWYGEK